MTRPMYLVMCAALIVSPCFFSRGGRRPYTALPALLGAAGLLTSLVTELAAQRFARFTPSREFSEAVADPGNHLESALIFD
jgi:hypothetical protein